MNFSARIESWSDLILSAKCRSCRTEGFLFTERLMEGSDSPATSSKLWLLLIPALLVLAAILTVQSDQAGTPEPVAGATYTRGVLDLTIPYHAAHGGSWRRNLQRLDP